MRIVLTIAFLFISLLSYSQETQGTRITAPIVPNDSNDVYPTHDEYFGRGGYRAVGTITQRDAIKTALRKEGMLVKVIIEDKLYTLNGGIANTDWQELKFASDSINNLRVSQRLKVKALPAPYDVTFPFIVEDYEGYNRAAVSSKGMLITGRQHDPTVNVDALAMIGAKNQVSGIDGLAIGTNVKAVSDSSIAIGKNLANNIPGSQLIGYGSNYIWFDKDSARVGGKWPFSKGGGGGSYTFGNGLKNTSGTVGLGGTLTDDYTEIHVPSNKSFMIGGSDWGSYLEVKRYTDGEGSISLQTGNGANTGYTYLQLDPELLYVSRGSARDFTFDNKGIYYGSGIDTSLFTDRSLVNKRWVLDRAGKAGSFQYTKTLDSAWIWTTKRGKSFAIGMDPGFLGNAYCWGNNVYPEMNFSFMGRNFSSGSYSIGTVTSTYMELGSYNYLNNNHRIKISNSEIVFSNHNEEGIKLKNKSLQYLAHATVQNNLWVPDKFYVDSTVTASFPVKKRQFTIPNAALRTQYSMTQLLSFFNGYSTIIKAYIGFSKYVGTGGSFTAEILIGANYSTPLASLTNQTEAIITAIPFVMPNTSVPQGGNDALNFRVMSTGITDTEITATVTIIYFDDSI